eukprot:scaffold731_cov261-Pinguiococcus_pyrenoidosus.AAC.91
MPAAHPTCFHKELRRLPLPSADLFIRLGGHFIGEVCAQGSGLEERLSDHGVLERRRFCTKRDATQKWTKGGFQARLALRKSKTVAVRRGGSFLVVNLIHLVLKPPPLLDTRGVPQRRHTNAVDDVGTLVIAHQRPAADPAVAKGGGFRLLLRCLCERVELP